MNHTARRKWSRAAQKLSAGRMRPACQCLDHAVLKYKSSLLKMQWIFVILLSLLSEILGVHAHLSKC